MKGLIVIFTPLTIANHTVLKPYLAKLTEPLCDYNINTLLMWNHIDHYSYDIKDSIALLIVNPDTSFPYAMMPLCDKANWLKGFHHIQQLFNNLQQPLEIKFASKEFATQIVITYPTKYYISPCREHFDYLHNANDLRTLKGGRFDKKRNHINKFKKTFAGRYLYKSINKGDLIDCIDYLWEWSGMDRKALADEEAGIKFLLKHQQVLDLRIGGIFIDGHLQACSIGSILQPDIAEIHVEKANPDLRGLYQVIQQEFLLHEFPDIQFVNREDDAGEEQIRTAKLSLHPTQLVEKYCITER